ncbi:hypothetical protein M758_5G007800 [Ceratodon purpureus]|nr:hypothetical protein M758_5G007800 [Ceratodon purpureus]
MAMVQGARAAVTRAGISASLFRALPAPATQAKLPVLCRSRSTTPAFASNSSLTLSNRRGRFGVVFCAPSSSVSVDLPAPEAPAPAALEVKDVAADLDLLDIRVGKVLKAWKHPEADSLFVEEVDVGEPEGPRTICSGLVKYVSQEKLEGSTVVVLANLKARNMRGVKSNGMLLCASDAAHENVELLSPPEGAVPGERIWFGSEEDQAIQKAAAAPNQVQKKKIWESIQPLLKTTDDCAAVFQDKPMRVSTGIVTCETLKGGNVS